MDLAQQRSVRPLTLGLIFVVAVLAAFLYTAGREQADPDQFWHVMTGKWIVENRQVPKTDPFSWYAAPRNNKWVAQEWLFGVVAYAVYSGSGWKGLYLFVALLTVAVVMLVYALARARGVNPMWSLLVMMASLSGLLWFAVPRPQMVTFLLVLLTALLLEKDQWPWALLCVLVGVNMHGGVWPLYILVFAYYEFPRRWWLIPLATAVTLINPNPVGVFLYPFQAFLSPVTSQINEFQATPLWDRKQDLVMYLALLLAVHRKRIHWRDAVFAIAFILLSLSALRHIQWFYVLVLPIMAPYIVIEPEAIETFQTAVVRFFRKLKPKAAPAPDEAPETAPPAEIASEGAIEAAEPEAGAAEEDGEEAGTGSSLPGRIGRSRLPELILIGALAIFAVYLGGRAYRQSVDVERWYPREMVAYIRLHNIKRFFNVWGEGGYFIYKGIPPMIDGRGDPYVSQRKGDPDMSKDFMSLMRLETSLRSFMLKYKIEYAVLPGGGLLSTVMYDPAFKWVKSTHDHALLRFDAKLAEGQGKSRPATSAVTTTRPGGANEATQTPVPTP